MLKNILNLDGAKALNKQQQQSINGGVSHKTLTPCGETGGSPLYNLDEDACFGYGYLWFNDVCWICH